MSGLRSSEESLNLPALAGFHQHSCRQMVRDETGDVEDRENSGWCPGLHSEIRRVELQLVYVGM